MNPPFYTVLLNSKNPPRYLRGSRPLKGTALWVGRATEAIYFAFRGMRANSNSN